MPKGIPNKPRTIQAGAQDGVSLTEAPKVTRADTVRQERRRRPGHAAHAGIKLAVDETKLDRNTYHYRFAADTGARISQLIADDYDIAPEGAKPDGNGLGSVTSALAGTDEAGKPYNHVLLRKRKDWFEADQMEKQKPIEATEEAIRRGNTAGQGTEMSRVEGAYTPNGVNIIERA